MENKGLLIGIAAVAIIGIAAFAFTAKKPDSAMTASTSPTQAPAMQGSGTEATTETGAPAMEATEAGSYKDGTYTSTGTYTSPAGQEEVEVTVTLADGVISDVQFVGKAVNEKSVFMQGVFSENYQPLVLGKNIDEVKLDKVSGSSLTPKGFNNALETIKAEAKS